MSQLEMPKKSRNWFGCLGWIVALILGIMVILLSVALGAQKDGTSTTQAANASPTQDLAVRALPPADTPAPAPVVFVDASKVAAPAEPAAVEAASVQVAAAVEPVAQPSPAEPIPAAQTGMTYEQVCGVDESGLTEIQLKAHASQFAGQTFTGWVGYVYDVQERGGTYVLSLSPEPKGLFWSGNINIDSIPLELAVQLNVEQRVVVSGQIQEVGVMFGVMCNPIDIIQATVAIQ
jgi:hypothetical protein